MILMSICKLYPILTHIIPQIYGMKVKILATL